MRAPKKKETSESSAAKKGESNTAKTSDSTVAKKEETIVAKTSESPAAGKKESTIPKTSDSTVAKKGESIAAETSESTAAKSIESPMTRMSGVGAAEQPSHSITLPSKAMPGYGGKIGIDKYRGGGDVESDSDREMTDVVILGDTKMSEGETSDSESESQSGSSSSSYSSAHSRANRKRTAEYSPEREPRRNERRPFPGVTRRGERGCRIHLPTRELAERAATKEMAMDDVEMMTDFTNSHVEAPRTGEKEKSISDATSGADIPKETLAGKRTVTAINIDAPFVVRNTVVKVPVQLLPTTSARALANNRTGAEEVENILQTTTTGSTTNVVTAHATRPINIWGQHGKVVAEVYKVLASMEPPWGSLCVCEEMTRRFPEIEPTALQMTVLAVLMTQRQCVRDLTLAGARRGPRRDENGQIFMELDLEYAHRYSDSY